MQVLLYARTSTTHHDQRPELQLDELRRFCAARGWDIREEITDQGFSGSTEKRPGLQRLMLLARERQVDCVLVLKLDRLFRSLRHVVTTLEEFRALGVTFVAVKDNLDQSTPSGQLMVHLIAAFAEFERELIRERVALGIAHARRKGKALGRPRRAMKEQIAPLRAMGLSFVEIARRLGISASSACRALNAD